MLQPYIELANAAHDLLAANCRQHRDRASRRLEAALLLLNSTPKQDPQLQLLHDLILYALEFEDQDPSLEPLLAKARALGLIP